MFVDGLGCMLRDESFHPLEFDHHLFFNKDSKNPLPSSSITSQAHPIIERVSFLCSGFSSCLSCLSCLSMFPNAANRFNGTWSLLPKGHKGPLFHSRMIRPVLEGGGLDSSQYFEGQLAATAVAEDREIVIEGDDPRYAKPFHERKRGSIDKGEVLVRAVRR